MPQLRQLARPAKIRSAVRRRWFEWRLARLRTDPPGPMVHLGSDYGGWYIPASGVDPGAICYSVGAGSDVSFDIQLIDRFGAVVHSFDPFALYGRMAIEAVGDRSGFHFHHCAIALRDGPVVMWGRQDERNGAVSAAGLHDRAQSFVHEGRSLPSLMAELGHQRIDLLKLDTEGTEYDLVPTLPFARWRVRVFCVELHHNGSVSAARRLIDDVCRQGYVLAHQKPPTSLTFVRA